MGAFRAALRAGTGIECDVRLSRDDEVVVFHDADLARMCGERQSTASLNSADLCSRRLQGSAERVPRLAELLALVGRRVPLLIELKTERRNSARLSAAVARTMGGASAGIGVMSFDPAVGAWLARHRPDVRRGVIISERSGTLARYAAIMRSRAQFLAVPLSVAPAPWVQRVRRRMPVYAWAVRTPEQARQVAGQVDSLIWEADGRP